ALRRGRNGITGVDYTWEGNQRTVSCEQCVVAAGVWTYDLLRGIGVNLPIIRKKCIVLVVKAESMRVDKITVCLDVDKEDGTISDASLVPFRRLDSSSGTLA